MGMSAQTSIDLSIAASGLSKAAAADMGHLDRDAAGMMGFCV
jgi:hypothetical protein